MNTKDSLFDVQGMNIVITGAAGALCSAMARELAARGARVAILDIREAEAEQVAEEIRAQGGEALALGCDVTESDQVRDAADRLLNTWNKVDALVNGAGGNHPKATTTDTLELFDLLPEDVESVLRLNFMGTLIPCQVFGRIMARRERGVVVNIASMNSVRPLTRIPAYSAAKAGVANLTQWLAVHMAQRYSPQIRVNAIAPGFFITSQTRYLLYDAQTGGYTERGEKVVTHTPLSRMGLPEDLLGTLVWLLSPASGFVTGIMVPVDGGFSAYSGV